MAHDRACRPAPIAWQADPATFRVTYVTPAAEELLGYAVERWLGQPDFWATLIHPDDRERALAARSAAIQQDRPQIVVYRAVRADGQIVRLHEIVHWTPASEGLPQRLQGVLLETFEPTGDEERWRRVAARLGELRRPLTHIKGFVSTLRQPDVEWDEATRRELLSEVERATDHLAQLVSELLVVCHSESSGRQPKQVPRLCQSDG